MSYEVFKRTAARVETPTVSLVPDGRISLNAATCRILAEAGTKFVLLLWDGTNNKMALKAAHKGDKNTYAVSLGPGRHSGSLRAKTFLNHIGWSATKRERLSATWDERERMFEITLPLHHLGADKGADSKRKMRTGL